MIFSIIIIKLAIRFKYWFIERYIFQVVLCRDSQKVLQPGSASDLSKMGLCAQRRLMTELKGKSDSLFYE